MALEQQLWFLVWENISAQSFTQVMMTLEDVMKNGISLGSILRSLSLVGDVHSHAFFIHSQTMQASVQMLNDKAIHGTWQLYCRQDPVVTITVRKNDDPSPNTSRAPSYSAALTQRRSASGELSAPEIPIHTPPRNVSLGLDPVHLEPVADLPEEEKVIVVNDEGGAQAYSKEYLIFKFFMLNVLFHPLTYCVGWIDSQLKDRKPLTDIVVQAQDVHGELKSTQLTRSVWERSLVRGKWRHDFAPIWAQHVVATHERESTIAQLCDSNPHFTQSCINFIHDLRTFSGNKDSRTRLDSTGHEFFLGKPYFDSATVNAILHMKTTKGSVAEELRALAEKRVGGEICAAHDLSPFFESVLGVSWDKERKKALSTQHEMSKAKISAESSKLKKLAHKSSKVFTETFGRKKGGGRGARGGHGGSPQESRG